jgi:xeroderma pigmentosum group C-complementing protein
MQQYVPAGATYIDSVYAEKAAKAIGIQYVPAVTGFETRGLRTVPVTSGIIVLKDQEAMLWDSIITIEAMKSELLYEKQEKKIIDRWEKLVRSAISREWIRNTYGH